jgi:uncharacterized protein DUF5671
MQTVKRLYLYLMSGITLAVLAVGLRMVLVVLFDAIGVGRGDFIGGDPNADRQQLSLAAALIGVGLPVWAVHWWLAERGLRAGTTHSDAERGSAVRAFYLTLALGLLLLFGAAAGIDLLRGLLQRILNGDSPEFAFSDAGGSLATLLVTGIAWAYHVSIRRRDMRVGPLADAAAWLPRVYLYGAALAGVLAFLQAIGDLVAVIGDALLPPSGAFFDPGTDSFPAANSLSVIAVSGAIWIGHWWYAARLIRDPSWRGDSERPARLRVAYFVGVILFATFSVLRLSAAALSAVLVPLFGASSAFGGSLTGSDMVRVVGVSLVSAVPWAIAWWFHRASLSNEAAVSGDPQREDTAVRLDLHAVALVGLGFGAVGFAWLLGLAVDVLFGGNRTVGDGVWRSELAIFVPLALIGSGVWLWRWWRIQARHAAQPAAEASSTVRRSYVLLILAASVIASLGSAALVLYRLFGAILGANLGGNTVGELSTPIGVLVVAGIVAMYHGQVLRKDLALRPAEVQPEGATAGSAAAQRRLVLIGEPGSDLGLALADLRTHLPPGYRLDEG